MNTSAFQDSGITQARKALRQGNNAEFILRVWTGPVNPRNLRDEHFFSLGPRPGSLERARY